MLMTPPQKPGTEGDMQQIPVYSTKSVKSYKLIVLRPKSYIRLNVHKPSRSQQSSQILPQRNRDSDCWAGGEQE